MRSVLTFDSLWTFNVGNKRKYGNLIEISHRERKKERCMLMQFTRNLQAFLSQFLYQQMTH